MARIMVLDDEEQWLELVRGKLSELGHEVRTTTDSFAALQKIRADRPDLVILDLRMPVNGALMLQTLREDCPGVPVVMHTVYSGYRHDPSLRGMAGFAVKNPDLAELVSVVDSVLAERSGKASPA